MRKLLLTFVCGMSLLAQPAAAKSLVEKVKDATAMLYSQTPDGGMRMRCTTTVFEAHERDDKKGYLLATAAHCVAVDDLVNSKVKISGASFFISFDEASKKIFHPVHIEAAGFQSRGDDFAVLHAYTDEEWDILELGDVSSLEPMDEVLNVSAPAGLGLQVLKGHISLVSINRPVQTWGLNWQSAMLVNLSSGPGASGSAVVSVKQKKIIGFVVGGIGGNPTTVVLTVNRFALFVQAARIGRYAWF
jgi:hypothetical protein